MIKPKYMNGITLAGVSIAIIGSFNNIESKGFKLFGIGVATLILIVAIWESCSKDKK